MRDNQSPPGEGSSSRNFNRSDPLKQLKGWRLWLYRITALTLLPVVLFLVAELFLRLFGVGYPTNFTIPCEVNGEPAHCNNDKFTWRFFSPELERSPNPLVIPENKPPRTYRVFILGASAALGDPIPSYGFGRILEVMLRDQYPTVDFEVVNTAVTAINSYVVLEIVKDLVRHQPDLLIVYLGNNEVVGPFGAGTVFTSTPPTLMTIRAGLLLKSIRVGQLLRKALYLAGAGDNHPKKWKGMEMFLEKQVRADDPGLARVYSHFRRNLQDISRAAQKAGIKVVFCTVASNLRDSAPFASLHRRDLADHEEIGWENLYQSGVALELEGKHAEAVGRYLEADRIDGHFADLQYRLAQNYWALGNYKEARRRYVQARDLDVLRFRADTRINDIIREVAGGRTQDGIYLVDAVRSFEDHSPRETPGGELFYEHVHMNFAGNLIVAKGIFQQIREIFPPWVHAVKNETPLLKESEYADRLGFTGYDRYRVSKEVLTRLQKPPFTKQLDHQERISRLQESLDTLQAYSSLYALADAAKKYRQAIEMSPSDPWLRYNFARLLKDSQNPGEAAEQLKVFLRYLPNYPPAYEMLAEALILQGRLDEAISWGNLGLTFKSDFAPLHLHIAYALARKGEFDQSIRTYEAIARLAPEMSADIYNQIGRILVSQDRLNEASQVFRKALTLEDKSQSQKTILDVQFNLGHVLKKLGKNEEASRHLTRALEGYREELSGNPNSGETHAVLARTYLELGYLEEATEHYRHAVDLKPSDPGNHLNLIKVLEAQGRYDEAKKASREAIRFMRENNQMETAARFQKYLTHLNSQESGRE